MNSAPVYPVEIAGLQRAVGQACDLLANLGESPDLHAPARGASSRVSRLAAYGASDAVLAEAVELLRGHAVRLAYQLDGIRTCATARHAGLEAALMHLTRPAPPLAPGSEPAAEPDRLPQPRSALDRYRQGRSDFVRRLSCGLRVAATLTETPRQTLLDRGACE